MEPRELRAMRDSKVAQNSLVLTYFTISGGRNQETRIKYHESNWRVINAAPSHPCPLGTCLPSSRDGEVERIIVLDDLNFTTPTAAT